MFHFIITFGAKITWIPLIIYCLDMKSGYMFWHLYKIPRIIELFARKTLARFLTTLSIAHLHVT